MCRLNVSYVPACLCVQVSYSLIACPMREITIALASSEGTAPLTEASLTLISKLSACSSRLPPSHACALVRGLGGQREAAAPPLYLYYVLKAGT